MNRSLRVAAILAALVSVPIAAQPPQPQPPVFSGTTRTVAVYATVTNAQGRLVPDLTREDFAVDDNGKRQTLTLFSNDIQPITVIVLLDRSGSMKPNFDLEERAAEAFVHEMLPGDRARVGSFAKYIQIDPADFTSDTATLIKILKTELQQDGPTPLWNAVDRGVDKLLLEQGRRVILVFTDGVDMPMDFSGHNKSLKDAIKRAEENDVMVYAIGLAGQNGMPDRGRGVNRGALGGLGGRGLGGYAGGGPGMEGPDEGLPKIATATGGGYFELKSAIDLAPAFARVANELHHQYALGFSPAVLDGKMHELTMQLSKPELHARARARYLAAKVLGGPR